MTDLLVLAEAQIAEMRDLIDREAVMEIILMPQNVSITEQLEMLKKLPSAQQWTPVSEGLPEKEVEVLVTTSWGNVCMAWCDNGKWRAEYINGYDDDEILAWMPLPEPYEGGDA